MIDEVSNIEQYISFIEELAQDHHFSDPHFSYDSGNSYQAVKKKNQKIYVSSNDGVVNGIFVWLIIQEEQYVELIVGLSRATDVDKDSIVLRVGETSGYKWVTAEELRSMTRKELATQRILNFIEELK